MKVVTRIRAWSLTRWLVASVLLAGLGLAPWLTTAQSAAQPQNSVIHKDGEYGRYVYADLAEKVMPSVVTVYVKRDLKKELSPEQLKKYQQFRRFFDDPQLRQFFGSPFGTPGPDMPEPGQGDENDLIQKGSGSGVVISADGYIVTNWHVVGEKKDNPEIRVVFSDNSELSGKEIQLIDSSPLIDLALLKVNKSGLKPMPWGDSDALRIGERVGAIGSPLDLRETVTQGIICAKHRAVGLGLGDMLQTDAVINPGSSGGALTNLDGQLIGINRMIATPGMSGRWEGYGFAIPSNDVRYFVDQVIKYGKMTYGYIGVTMATEFEDSPKMREALGLSKDQKGVLVTGVKAGSPAAKAGLQEGDLITSADSKKIEDTGDLLGYVARHKVGSAVRMTIMRPQENQGPKQMDVTLTIGERPSEKDLEAELKGQMPREEQPEEGVQNSLGLAVEPYNQDNIQGVRVTGVAPGSPAAKAGLKNGDVILKLNRLNVKTPGDFAKALKEHTKGRPHSAQIMRGGRRLLVAIDEK